MAWTPKQKKAHSARMKAMWEKKKWEKVSATMTDDQKFNAIARKLELDAKQDMVNHPSHYTFSKYEVADVSDEWFRNEPLLWNSNKYTARWDKKGDPVENLEKAIWYIQRKINQLKAEG